MISKMPAPAKAGVADFSDKIMRRIKENRERCRFNLIDRNAGTLMALAVERGTSPTSAATLSSR